MAGPTSYFDPSNLDSLDASTRDLVERRAAVLGSAYRLFYTHPIQLVRGSGTTLYDIEGNEYLDAYNNVPSVGHAHPRVAAAIAAQASQLSTHTRYLQDGIVDYAERLLNTTPTAIGNIIFTCTGSEANDLALRVAKLATGGTGVVVTANAYHGVTTEVAAISPSLGGIESIAPWVRLVSAPDIYREPNPTERFARDVAAAFAELDAAGHPAAAFIVDTIFASDGIEPGTGARGSAPTEVDAGTDRFSDSRAQSGFLGAAVAAARATGALFIADEVQPGFGRLGTGMWGFDRHGVIPDIITVGKPMGNGHPVAAMMARPDLIDEFGRHSRYFNTFGGSSVSIAAATATLDVLEDEGLIANAAAVGDYLLSGLSGLSRQHPVIGNVRGIGLFIGVELVLPGTTIGDEAVALRTINRLRERRVLLATAGAGNNVLKIRPPLPFSRADADRLLTELDGALSER
jgi:4-aminobutyrate aminotransferase-like enzyme